MARKKKAGSTAKRGGKKTPPKPGTQEALVAKQLTDDDIQKRAMHLAGRVKRLNYVKEQKRKATRKFNDEMRDIEKECAALAEQIDTGIEMVPESDLFAGDQRADQTLGNQADPPKTGNGAAASGPVPVP